MQVNKTQEKTIIVLGYRSTKHKKDYQFIRMQVNKTQEKTIIVQGCTVYKTQKRLLLYQDAGQQNTKRNIIVLGCRSTKHKLSMYQDARPTIHKKRNRKCFCAHPFDQYCHTYQNQHVLVPRYLHNK